jgi:hypothetical protein
MLSLSLPGRVFLCTLPTDMRKSFDSLVGLVEQQLGQDPLAGETVASLLTRSNASSRSGAVGPTSGVSSPWGDALLSGPTGRIRRREG